MPQRKSFAEVSRAVTKKNSIKVALRRRVASSSSADSPRLKRKDTTKSLKNPETPRLGDVEEQQGTPRSPADAEPNNSPDAENGDNAASLAEESETVTLGGGDDDQIVVLGEDAAEGAEPGDEDGDEDDEEKKKEEEGEKKNDSDTPRKFGRFKKLTKKQLRLQQEEMEEEMEREERRKRREERRKKKELAAELAAQEAPQSFDEAEYKESIYTMVKASLGLVMHQDELNITVDNLTPLMKGLELDTSDEDVKELIMDALLNTYGLIDPSQIDGLILKKKIEKDLDDLEECVDAAFAVIDQDRDGIITQNDVYRLMIHLGEVLWDSQVAAMIQAADIDGDGKISKKDLFLFLLGREKRIKLEDQILSKYANNKEDSPTEAETQAASAAEPPKEEAATVSQQNDKNSTDVVMKVTPPKEDSKAFERRRKMFSGYASLVVSANRFSNNGPNAVDLDINKTDRGVLSPEIRDTELQFSGQTDAKKTDTEAVSDENTDDIQTETEAIKPDEDPENQNLTNKEEKRDDDPHRDDCPEKETPQPHIHHASSDWSDSGHVGSDRDGDDTFTEDSEDDDTQLECLPLALEAGICYLPAPEFDEVAVPSSTRTPRSRMSSRTCVTPTSRAASQEPQTDRDTNSALAHRDTDLDLEAITSARTERTSEYDSDRNDDVYSLPETSQQNLILKEIEQQVLHTKEALKAKEPSLGGVKLKEKYAAMVTCDPDDGCESVVESEIHPTYVPPCARDSRSGLRLSARLRDLHRLGKLKTGADISAEECSVDKEQQPNVDTLTADEYANSTAEIVSKGYVNFSSPRSVSTMTNKLPSNDITDDVFSPPHDVTTRSDLPQFLDSLNFDKNMENINDLILEQNGQTQKEEGSSGEAFVENHEDSSFSTHKEVPVDGVPAQMRPTCDRARKLSARKRPKTPVRRSLTCHTITVKDLSGCFHLPLSPTRKNMGTLVRSRSSIRPHSLHRMQSESSMGGSSPGRPQSSPGTRQWFASGRDSSVVSPDSSRRRQSSFDPRRTQSLSRTNSTQNHRESSTSRVLSPVCRMDSYRSQGYDSFRTPKDSSRSQTTTARSYRDSAHSQRESCRSRLNTGRSQINSYNSRKESFRVRSGRSTSRSGARTDRSLYDDDEEDDGEEEFRFYGPNFDVIMSQKGEPEELLRESLYRDAIVRAGGQHHPIHNLNDKTHKQNGSPSAAESRKSMISRQLERVKEMEMLIKQRRERMDLVLAEDNAFRENFSADPTGANRRHTLRRVKTATGIRMPRAAGTIINIPNHNNGDKGQAVRPRSCLARRRTVSTTIPKVVAIADDIEVHSSVRAGPKEVCEEPEIDSTSTTQTHTIQTHRPQTPESVPEPVVHVIDLSSLLSDVNDPEPSGDVKSSARDGNHSKTFKPLARALCVYENARRRQAATASRTDDIKTKSAVTSISRQLERGIPYRPPTPPHYSDLHSDQSPSARSPRRQSAWITDYSRQDPLLINSDFSKTRNCPQNCSFMLGAVQGGSHPEQSPIVGSFLPQRAHQHHKTDVVSGEKMTSSGVETVSDDTDTALTFEFPERSVCVLKGRPALPVGSESG